MIRPFLPMLAVASEPFDSSEYLFEVKWDGVRAIACVQNDRWRLWRRELADYTDRYPELDALRRLPSGIVLDGELVVLRDGRADLSAILRRHQLGKCPQDPASEPPSSGNLCPVRLPLPPRPSLV